MPRVYLHESRDAYDRRRRRMMDASFFFWSLLIGGALIAYFGGALAGLGFVMIFVAIILRIGTWLAKKDERHFRYD